MITKTNRLFIFAIMAMLVIAGWPAGNDVYGRETALMFSVQASHGMVVTGEALATKAGVEVLKKGGNAVDAA
jgi:gamma-glutamyltranspeptidase/glutathione hydrolase